jgi:hypothetical protein
MGLSILGVSDSKYFPHLLILATSVVKNMPTAHFRAHCINVSDDMIATLTAISPHIEISRETTDQSAAYSENRRAFIMKEMLERGDEYIFYLDADAIVRKPLDGLVDLLRKSDGLLLRQASVHHVTGGDRNRFAGGALAFRNTELARAFVSRWSTLVTSRIDDRFANQECLAPAYGEFADRIVIDALPFRYIDWKLSLGSPVWIGKGPVVDSAIYRLEVERYEKSPNLARRIVITLLQIFFRISRSGWEFKNTLLSLAGRFRRRIFGLRPEEKE